MTAQSQAPVTETVVFQGVMPTVLADLHAPTPDGEIKERQAYGRGGPISNPDGSPKMLSYVDARYVQERLDEVVGPANWQTKYEDTPGGIRCGIGIYVDGQWVWKWDAGIPSNIEPVKGAHSDAFKRAAVQWGIARDLYGDREDEDDFEPAPTVMQQVQPNGRQQRYAQQPQQQAPVAQQVTTQEPPPECAFHGPMIWKSGVKNGKHWQGWFCSVQQCTTSPQWR